MGRVGGWVRADDGRVFWVGGWVGDWVFLNGWGPACVRGTMRHGVNVCVVVLARVVVLRCLVCALIGLG